MVASKPGWAEIGGKRHYFRSKAERNYARYLEWCRSIRSIKEWEFEPKTFWFEKIRRGVTSYKPDFGVTDATGEEHYAEVKGWMDPKSKTKLKRMAKYYPAVKVVVIGRKQMAEIRKKLGAVIPGWE